MTLSKLRGIQSKENLALNMFYGFVLATAIPMILEQQYTRRTKTNLRSKLGTQINQEKIWHSYSQQSLQ